MKTAVLVVLVACLIAEIVAFIIYIRSWKEITRIRVEELRGISLKSFVTSLLEFSDCWTMVSFVNDSTGAYARCNRFPGGIELSFEFMYDSSIHRNVMMIIPDKVSFGIYNKLTPDSKELKRACKKMNIWLNYYGMKGKVALVPGLKDVGCIMISLPPVINSICVKPEA